MTRLLLALPLVAICDCCLSADAVDHGEELNGFVGFLLPLPPEQTGQKNLAVG